MTHKLAFALTVSAALVGCFDSSQEDTQQVSIEAPAEEVTHQTRTALDWDGVYKGTLPCQDCPSGVQVLIDINKDGSFMFSRSYEDRMSVTVMEEGKVEWNQAGNTISIDEWLFFVSENQLVLVDEQGQNIADDKHDTYVLLKD